MNEKELQELRKKLFAARVFALEVEMAAMEWQLDTRDPIEDHSGQAIFQLDEAMSAIDDRLEALRKKK